MSPLPPEMALVPGLGQSFGAQCFRESERAEYHRTDARKPLAAAGKPALVSCPMCAPLPAIQAQQEQ